jgi:1-aminocyclopropane-1-carboxylate deaminase/D-cysteine desulfhydrase-like pyridoxal-dependent ACC family enzyme
MKQIARTEGIVVDPVYSSKALAGILGRIGEGSLTSDDTVVFLHTGGTPAIFTFAEQVGAVFREEV